MALASISFSHAMGALLRAQGEQIGVVVALADQRVALGESCAANNAASSQTDAACGSARYQESGSGPPRRSQPAPPRQGSEPVATPGEFERSAVSRWL